MTELSRATVLGTGTMGPGMGAVLARAGLQVTLFDVNPEALERAQGMVGMVEGVLDRLEVPKRDGGGVSYESERAAALDSTDVVAEAIPEQLKLKRQTFLEIEDEISPETIIASNTSGIPATKLAQGLQRPERVIGWHWSNPPHLIPMNEIIPGEQTSPEVTNAIQQLTRRIGYHPVTLKKEVPGFVENRVLYAIMRECLALVDEGVIDLEGLDLNVKWGIGYKLAVVPPIQLLDMAGLDIYTSVAGYLNRDLSDEKGVSKTAADLKDKGRLGIKTGGGFFDYTPERIKELQQQRAAALVAVRKALD
ncbi:MAG: 3-hydroxyacyl-CoA dehydrogenase family protein [Solirubrobacterales bacterium]|nr:3-hydroxyacyl-CoA dehydrogenase family protein [Solirubrobacterales bacterium]MBV9167680.1 3-hydroxyacyl-CoA dehydrogenase family protein [Solirubrobacterales bacterium]MBV9535143.1 3-hydroxyacyl-CoA dehydrogenase family protein [Solirubrobacterales bacterium]